MKHPLIALFLLISIVASSQPIEELEYFIRFGFIRGGKATLISKDTVYNNNPAVHFYMSAQTVGLPNTLFPVHDIYESIVNPQSYLPYKAIRNIKEQNYRYYNEAFFFHETDSLYSQRSGGKIVPPKMVDIITVFFYLRQNSLLDKLDNGEEFDVPVFHADEHFMMTVKYLGKEKINSAFGKVECHVVSPRVKKGKVLKRSDGLKFYISNDSNKIPLLLEFDMRVGALKCILKSYKQNGNERIVN